MKNFTLSIFFLILLVLPSEGSTMSEQPVMSNLIRQNYTSGGSLDMELKKENDIKRLVRLMDPSEKNVEWLRSLFKSVTKLRESEWDKFLGEIDFDRVVSLYYPLYDKYFTHDEIKELIAFYSSDVGVKLACVKSGSLPQQFTQDELSALEQFKKNGVGRKYNNLLDKITHQYVESVKKYIDSLR